MRLYSILLLALTLVFTSANVVNGIFDDIGISDDDAKSLTVKSFGSGFIVTGDYKQKAHSLPDNLKAEGTRALIKFAKEYSTTDDFKKKYAKYRNEHLGYATKKISNPFKMIDKAMDKQLNKGDDEKRMPSDPSELIKQRLKEFLKTSATVDFDAELNGNQFAKPSYEAKSGQWKQCFRAGKVVVDAAREEAQAWLTELE